MYTATPNIQSTPKHQQPHPENVYAPSRHALHRFQGVQRILAALESAFKPPLLISVKAVASAADAVRQHINEHDQTVTRWGWLVGYCYLRRGVSPALHMPIARYMCLKKNKRI